MIANPPSQALDFSRIRSMRTQIRRDSFGTSGPLKWPLGCSWDVTEALEAEFGLPRVFGSLVRLDGMPCLNHAWNVLPGGVILDATADQFGAAFPGDILTVPPGDYRHCRYVPNAADYDELAYEIVIDSHHHIRLFRQSGPRLPTPLLGRLDGHTTGEAIEIAVGRGILHDLVSPMVADSLCRHLGSWLISAALDVPESEWTPCADTWRRLWEIWPRGLEDSIANSHTDEFSPATFVERTDGQSTFHLTFTVF